MPESKKPVINLAIKEVYPKLCPKCQLAIRKIIGEKLAEQVVKE